MFTKNEKNIVIALGFLAISSIALAYISIPSSALEVHYLDVGQGDAIFIQTPEHYQIIIDGGAQNSLALRGVSKIVPFYDRSIDLVIATHLDADHIGGLLLILEEFDVQAVLVSQDVANSPLSERFFEIIDEQEIKLIKIVVGDKLVFDNGIELNFISPMLDYEYFSDNDSSIVAKLVYKNDSFLFTGDIEKRSEIMLAQNVDISAEVLKVAHHGSKTSSNDYFLDRVNPKLAVIQVGENSYGHPHASVLKRFKNRGIEILRNDQNGVISIYSYGNSI
ncbi:MAG: ComEC/Rec2 family competence protein [Candidatus Spechtbacterales bacterium]|nr:ComEC/Rec2 family competence protein [Candidatus Spechtbacterales bacterium]